MTDRIFNTNERYAPGRTDHVLSLGVIAIGGFPDGPGRLQRQELQPGDRIFAYANGQGMRAVGFIGEPSIRIVERGMRGRAFWDEDDATEYHIKVHWIATVPSEKAVSFWEMTKFLGVEPTIRQAVSRTNQGMEDWLETEIRKRAKE